MLDQAVISFGVTLSQCLPSSAVRQISPSFVPHQRSPSRAGEGAIFEPEPSPARTHVELIVQRVGLAKTERFLFAVKDLVHHETNAGVPILWQRERDHRPRPSAPRERGVGDVLVFGKRRHVRIPQSQEMFAGDRVVRDDQASLAIDQGNWTAEAASPETSPVHLAGGFGVAKSGKRTGGVYLLSARVGEGQRQRRDGHETRAVMRAIA